MANKKQKDSVEQKLSEKILLHIANCADFSFSYTFKKGLGLPQFPGKVFRDLIGTKEKDFRDGVTELKKLKFIEKKKSYNGSIIVSLTDKGKLRILNMKFKSLSRRRELWDGKWRMVAFDIPEERRKGRSALRYKMRLAGFYELQESLFLYPYDCEKEIDEFAKLFRLEKHIRFAVLEFIDTHAEIERFFRL